VFNVPKEDVVNYFVWRQKDAIRNSVQALGQAHFSQKQLQGQSCTDIKLMLLQEKNIKWEDLPSYNRHGACANRKMSGWAVDGTTPVFTEDREYINPYVYPPEEIE
jgi:tRNA(His) 5'-end guanylyltransferase